MRVENNIEGWKELVESTEDKLIKRILINLNPVAIIEDTIYLNYIGEEEKKRVFMEYYNNKKAELIKVLSVKYDISKMKGGRELSEEKLEWLSELITKFKPKDIKFSISN